VDAIVRIKRLVIARRVLFAEKAEIEMAADSLTPELVYESILNALPFSRPCARAIPERGSPRGYT